MTNEEHVEDLIRELEEKEYAHFRSEKIKQEFRKRLLDQINWDEWFSHWDIGDDLQFYVESSDDDEIETILVERTEFLYNT